MAGCELAGSCWFYKELMPELPATSRYIKNHFCLRHYAECVRYQLHKQLTHAGEPEEEALPLNGAPRSASAQFRIDNAS